MIRTKGEPGTGDIIQAVRHMKMMQSEIKRIASIRREHIMRQKKCKFHMIY